VVRHERGRMILHRVTTADEIPAELEGGTGA